MCIKPEKLERRPGREKDAEVVVDSKRTHMTLKPERRQGPWQVVLGAAGMGDWEWRISSTVCCSRIAHTHSVMSIKPL